MLFKGPQARRYTQKAVHTQGGTHKRRYVAAAVMLLKEPQARRYMHNAVHTQGETHKKRSVATAGVMLFKGPQHTDGGAHTRRNTQKAVCGHCRSHVIEGATGKAVHTEGGAHTRRYTQRAVHTQGGTHKRWSMATAGVLLLVYGGGDY